MKLGRVFFICRLFAFCLGALFYCGVGYAATDDEVVAHFKKEAARIKAELAAEPNDMGRVQALQLEMKALLDRTVAQVSEPLRSVLRITQQVVNPLIEESVAYMALVQAKTEAGVFDYPTATSAEVIERRLKEIGELETRYAAFAKRLNSFDTDMATLLDESRIKPSDQDDILERIRARLGPRIGAMRAVRTLETATYVEIRKIYGLQREHLGKWSVEEGRVVFQEKAEMEAFERHANFLKELGARQDKARSKALGISPAR